MKEKMQEKEFWEELVESEELIQFATTPARAYMIVGQLQLALRHPSNNSYAAQIAKEFIENFTEAICSIVPEARASIQQGRNPAYDVTDDYFNSEFR